MRTEVTNVAGACPPAWVERLLAGEASGAHEDHEASVSLRVRVGARFAWVEAVVSDAADLPEPAFRGRVEAAYERITEALSRLHACYPVRFWNYLPEIRRTDASGLDRYMGFNAARSAAYRRCYGQDRLGEDLPTASALDAGGRDLVVHALAADRPGRSFENPRQVPAYRYSSDYGPTPPLFARATAVAGDDGRDRLLIGGTASVVGERSRHAESVEGQLAETEANLTALLASAGGDPSRSLEGLREVRAYVVRNADRRTVVERLTRRMPQLRRVEVMAARLCRPSLLVEIEGVAACPAGTAAPESGGEGATRRSGRSNAEVEA